MYRKHFGLTRQPFSIAPNPRFIYMSPQHREALAHLLFGVSAGGGFVQLTGEVGTGKTTLCRALIERLPDDVDIALILNPRVSAVELVASVCDELQVSYPEHTDSIKVLTDALNSYLLKSHAAGRRTVLIVDEAQNLSVDVLEQVRLLTNLETSRTKLLQIILVGQPELRDLLARQELRQLAQRITARFHLAPISREETAAYIRHRLRICGSDAEVFDARAIERVHRLSGGIPRLINILCDRAMLGAFVEGRHVVDKQIVRKAAAEVLPRGSVDMAGHARRRSLVATLLLLLLLAVIAGLVGFSQFPQWRETLTAKTDDGLTADVAVAKSEPDEPVPEAATTEQEGGPQRVGVIRRDEPVATTIQAIENEKRQTATATAAQSPSVAAPAADESKTQQAAFESPAAMEQQAADPLPPQTPSTSVVTTRTELPADEVATAAPLREPQPPQLSQLLSTAGASASARAWSGLYRLWGYDSQASDGQQACAQASAAGLSCISDAGSLGMLQQLDRPAILLLNADTGRQIPVLLSRLAADSATLAIDGVELRVSKAELEKHWFGAYRLLWKKTPTGKSVLREGYRNSDVAWFRERLQRIMGDTVESADPQLFDNSLYKLVASFQRSQGLLADGVAGARTFIALNNRDRDPAIPRLSDAVADARN